MIRGFQLTSFIIFLFLSLPAFGVFETIEESGETLIVRFTLGGSTVGLIGLPPDGMPQLSVIDAESDLIDEAPGEAGGELYELVPVGYWRFQRIAKLIVRPYQPDPSGKVRVYRSITFKLEFPPILHAPPSQLDRSPAFERMYNSTLLNPRQSRFWRVRRGKRSVQAASALPSTSRGAVKIKIVRKGIYVIRPIDLEKAGVNVSSIDPRTFKLICRGEEKNIIVDGEEDGSFDPGDRIVFYGEEITRNRFTDVNVYWLIWGGRRGKRAIVKDGSPKTPSAAVPIAFKTKIHLEEDRFYDPLERVTSELADRFFWTGFNGSVAKMREKFLLIKLPRAVRVNRDMTVRVRFQGISYKSNATHRVEVKINGNPVLQAEWKGQEECVIERRITQSRGIAEENSFLITAYDRNNTPESEVDFYLDWIEFEYWRSFDVDPGGMEFTSDIEPPITGPVRFELKGFPSREVEIYQVGRIGITARIVNVKIEEEEEGFKASMEDTVTQPTHYYAIVKGSYKLPEEIVLDKPSNLRNPANSYDYVIISHKSFIEPIKRLAEYRESQGLKVLIVDVEDVYDEFSHGVFNPHAIRSFLKYAFFNWEKPPTYVLLVGDASYDYKGVVRKYYRSLGVNINIPPVFVPTYHAYAPVSGEAAIDQRFVEVVGDDKLPDMIISRLPVQHPSEVENIIDKIIEYENLPPEDWQCRVMQIADDNQTRAGDDEFERSRERLFQEVIPIGYEPVKIYLRVIGSPMRCNRMIIDELNKGVIIAEYSGHGGGWTWADENIFRGDDIAKLKNKGRYPFVITTTCLNGFFDMPQKLGERNLAEEFLISPDKGAVATLSPTRLTFAHANSAFDMVLYEKMFKLHQPIIGEIVTQAKVEFISSAYEQWISGAEQYTLFGDPAMKLKLPKYTIKAELDLYSVDPSTELVLKRNAVYDKLGMIVKGFNADMTATLIYPNNLDITPDNDLPNIVKRTIIWNGRFGDIRFSISPNAIPGEGIIRLKAISEKGLAVGGVKFSVYRPTILRVWHELTDDSALIYAEIQDNAGIKQVECQWSLTIDLSKRSTRMIPKGKGIYVTQEPLALPKFGYSLRYQVVVVDIENNIAVSPQKIIPAPIGVNLAVSKLSGKTTPSISYGYSEKLKGWVLKAEFENKGDRKVKTPVLVCFFDGDPDKDKNFIVDRDAVILGKAVIPAESWRDDKEVLQKAEVEILLKKPLKAGTHMIYVWIDPEMPDYDHEDNVLGQIKERDEKDNKGVRQFLVSDLLLGEEDLQAYSLDRILNINAPKDAVIDTATLTVTAIDPYETGQKDLLPAFAPALSDFRAFKLELSPSSSELIKPISIKFSYDEVKLKEYLRELMGFEEEISPVQRNKLLEELNRWSERTAVFKWDEQLKAWRKMESKLVGRSLFHISSPVGTNSSSYLLRPSNVSVDPTLTPTGDWVIVFLDKSRYALYFRSEGGDAFEKVGIGRIGNVFQNDILGIKLKLLNMNVRFGDSFAFSTKMLGAEEVGAVGFRNENEGNGTLFIESLNEKPSIVGNWFILFVNDRKFQIFDQNGDLVRDKFGLPIKGEIGRPVAIESIGVRLIAMPGDEKFKAGDKFCFRTTFVGEVEVKIDKLGIFSLMHCLDETPPSVKIWINGETAQSGSVIPPRPEISILIEDTGFIDPSSVKIQLKADVQGKEGNFRILSPEEYITSGSGSILTIRYEPILHIGRYIFRISAADLMGNVSKFNGNDYLEMVFYVEEEPDLSPPQIKLYVNGKEVIGEATVDSQPHFVAIIRDKHGVDIKTLKVEFGPQGELRELEEDEYKLDFSPSQPETAMLFWEPDCPNGLYTARITIADTSGNERKEEFNVEVDEPVRILDLMNVPNPASGKTFFCYYLTQEPEEVTIKIYTITGRLVRTIRNASSKRKYNEEFWDCADELGRPLANGIYLYKVIVKTEEGKVEKISKLAIAR